MILVLGAFLYNAVCAVGPCHSGPRSLQSHQPVPVMKSYYHVSNPQDFVSPSYSNPRNNVHRNIPYPQRHRHSFPSAVAPINNFQNITSSSTPPSSSVKIPMFKSPFVVTIQSGKLQGFPMKTVSSREIIAFTKIPYAEKPVGPLAYRDPVPKKPWSGILKATSPAPDCLQIDGMQLLKVIGTIDCLYLSVFTVALPTAGQMKKMKVIVFINGGSFAFSSGSMYGPAYLLDKQDLVLLTFSYRLSSQGFLTTGNGAASGNWGLKDQRLLLQWVQANIASFGGDPKNVVLLGQNSGAVSVHLHMMSKQSQGLFSAGISHSANAFCFWGVRQDSIHFTYRLASSLQCPVNDSYALVECMRNLDPLVIAYHEAKLPEYKVFPGVFFGPVVEPEGPNAFLTDRPEKLYEQNRVSKVPWINGFLAGEGNGVSFLTWLYPFVMREVDSRWSELGPQILDIKGETEYTSKVAAYIKNFYFGHNPINFYTRNRLSQMVGDRLVVGAVYKGLRYHSAIAPTYGYFFNFTGKYGTASTYGLRNKDWGVSHDDDLFYLFNVSNYETLKVGPEYRFSQFLINVWANFASYGEPFYATERGTKISFWKPVNSSTSREVQVALLNGDAPKMIDFPFRNRIRLWQQLGLVSNSEIKQPPASTLHGGNNGGKKTNTVLREPEKIQMNKLRASYTDNGKN